jgi:RecB family exonuclease
MYESCPRRYAYHYVERLPGEVRPGQYAFGAAIHRAFEVYVRERIRTLAGWLPEPNEELLTTAFDEAISASGGTPAEVERWRTRAAPVLRAFLERETATDAEPVAVEIGFGVDLAAASESPAARFVGYIDRVDRRADGSIQVVDYKTGSPRDQAAVDADPQLTGYAFALASGGVHDPATGAVLRPASRVGLYFTDPACMVWSRRSPFQLEAFRDRILAVVAAIREGEFRARPAAGRCHWCEYRGVCADARA